jgi:hypothetical protein
LASFRRPSWNALAGAYGFRITHYEPPLTADCAQEVSMNLSFAGMSPAGLMSMMNSIVAFSQLPVDQQEKYLNEHPELLNEGLVGAALSAAGLSGPADKQRIAAAALQVAKQLNSADLIAQAQALLAKKQE